MRIYLDFDGPVVDNRPKYFALYSDALAEQGVAPLPQPRYWDLKRHRIPDATICALTNPEADPVAYVAFRDRWIEDDRYTDRDLLQPGIAEAARNWLTAGHEVRIATMRKRGDALRRELERFDVTSWCTVVLSEDANTGQWATKAALLRADLDGYEGASVLIGDTEGDILAAREAGLESVVVTNGIRCESMVSLFEPDAVLASAAMFQPR